ncbi:hypothetical protein MHY85_10565 [Cellulomonas sp. ACRRI]|uniref:hypothetical protein n=1 Tax=Cellulomonas sp. ACRRI TaxID=2918188 RepID=UPI001EF1AABE|nr:hypothetical protein [Cellulomonas sp. ACRRI]MCG7286411.1 hypothetical protein [Cellulomonas sp. ACRRI]
MSSSMMRDGGSVGAAGSGDVLSAGGYTVDIDALRSTANVVLGVADRVGSVAERPSMQFAEEYGYSLPPAATSWAQRFSYLIDGLAGEIEHAGFELRGTATAYTEVDIAVEARARQLSSALDGSDG